MKTQRMDIFNTHGRIDAHFCPDTPIICIIFLFLFPFTTNLFICDHLHWSDNLKLLMHGLQWERRVRCLLGHIKKWIFKQCLSISTFCVLYELSIIFWFRWLDFVFLKNSHRNLTSITGFVNCSILFVY